MQEEIVGLISELLENKIKEKEFVIKLLSKMKEQHEYVIVLQKIPQTTIKRINKILENIDELSIFTIGKKESKKLVLRYINKGLKVCSEKDLSKQALKSYIEGNYNMAIMIYMRILLTSVYINPKTCEMLGLSYLHLGEKTSALKYLKLSKKLLTGFTANKNGIEKIIKYLEQKETEDSKRILNYFLEKYDQNLMGIDINKLKEIAYYIKENNMTIEVGIKMHNLTNEQVLIIKLIYVRDYYIEGIYEEGDRLLQEVEKEMNKTPAVISLLQEIKTNRLLYKNEYSRKKVKEE